MGDGNLLDVLLDCFGAIAFFGQALAFLTFERIDCWPSEDPTGARRTDDA